MPDTMTPDPDAARWQAVLAREAAPDCGAFLYAVTTQGVFCRPGCPSRAPLRRNTRFFADAAGAEAAGFRACKRCDPKGQRAALQAEAVRAAWRSRKNSASRAQEATPHARNASSSA